MHLVSKVAVVFAVIFGTGLLNVAYNEALPAKTSNDLLVSAIAMYLFAFSTMLLVQVIKEIEDFR